MEDESMGKKEAAEESDEKQTVFTVKPESKKRNLEGWMEDLPEALHHIPILSLAIPGSHDAGSYSLDPHSEVAPDQPDLVYPSWFMGCIMKHIILNWSKTQSLTAREQLNSGIRYFDFRIATRGSTTDLFFVHGLYGAPIKRILGEVKSFLETHPKEVVLLDFQHFYKMTPENHHSLISLLVSTFETMLCPLVADPGGLTLNWMWARAFQVIIFYRDSSAKFHPFLWPSKLIPNPWPNTVSLSNLLEFLTDKYNVGRPKGVFYVTQAILTPTLFYILRHTFGNLRNLLVSSSQKQILQWLQDKLPSGLNIVMCDFVDMDDCRLPESIVELNYRAIEQKTKTEDTDTPSQDI